MVLRSVCTTFQVHLRKRLKSEPANHEMIAKPIIVLPFKTETPSFARLMVEAPEIVLPIKSDCSSYKIFILLCEKQLIYYDGYCKN